MKILVALFWVSKLTSGFKDYGYFTWAVWVTLYNIIYVEFDTRRLLSHLFAEGHDLSVSLGMFLLHHKWKPIRSNIQQRDKDPPNPLGAFTENGLYCKQIQFWN